MCSCFNVYTVDSTNGTQTDSSTDALIKPDTVHGLTICFFNQEYGDADEETNYFCLDLPPYMGIHHVFNVDKLKLYEPPLLDSAGYGNYRHQADVCHAYQILRRGGLKEENIVVFMYDDIAYSPGNPRPGIIINHPQGGDVYAGVPKVKDRTSNHQTYGMGSHVMQYGDIPLSMEALYLYMGFDPTNANVSSTSENHLPQFLGKKDATNVNQRDADLLYLWQKYKRSKDDTAEKLKAQKEMVELMTHRMHLDKSVDLIGKLLFGSEMGPHVLKAVRPPGQPLVDDWDCLKTMVRTFESHCGSLSQYGMKHMRALANICNQGVSVK